ncbi:hypothetical protein IFM89_015006 [Coptis chinensis]|uniref:Uncharacterized protein n=1 Tax=Coptis chinensis TaxID=261450 RepID=A0A835HJY3_9MAGN|nr:hypothetical protein IFM89_015006 [Coptis chinensis]
MAYVTYSHRIAFFNNDNSNTSIFKFQTSCPNPDCSYDICLTCCLELREGRQPGVMKHILLRDSMLSVLIVKIKMARGATWASRKRSGWEGAQSAEGSLTDVVGQFPYWRTDIDCSLPCPPIECGGCGSKILELRCSLKANWTSNLLKSAEKLTSNSPFSNVDPPIGCSSCLPFVGKVFKNPEVRRAAF